METIKNWALVILIIIVAVGGYQYSKAWSDAKEKIDAAEKQQADMKAEKVQLEDKVASLKAEQEKLDEQIASQKTQIGQYETEIADIKEQLKIANNLAIAEVDEQSIADNFKKTYGLEDIKGIRLVKIPPAEGGFKITSLVLPIDYIKLAVTAKNSQRACEQQAQLQEKIIGLNQEINKLTNEKLVLEQQKTQAYSEGYEKAFAMYLEVNKLYVDLLKAPPKVDLAPNWLQIAGGFLTGGLLCVL